jgi:hypothetical protein
MRAKPLLLTAILLAGVGIGFVLLHKPASISKANENTHMQVSTSAIVYDKETDSPEATQSNISPSQDIKRATNVIAAGLAPTITSNIQQGTFSNHDEQVQPAKSDRADNSTFQYSTLPNLALGCSVTCSDEHPLYGKAELLTNGIKEVKEDYECFIMHRGLQYVQIDLGRLCDIFYINVRHAFDMPYRYHDVIVIAAQDQDFTDNMQFVFNNDADNSSGRGKGSDKEYLETSEGITMPAKGCRARYVRAYSSGSNLSELNVYSEIEVYGNPVVN